MSELLFVFTELLGKIIEKLFENRKNERKTGVFRVIVAFL